jgi:dCMP deaminase
MKPCTTAVHAEVNAVAFAAKHGVATEGTTLYTLFAPCLACAPLIINAGIVRVVAGRLTGPAPNSLVGGGVALLEQAGIPVEVLEDVREGAS